MMTTTTTSSKSQTAYQWVRQRIVNGEFTPGYRLVLSSIADDLKMSVVPIREAVRRLEAEGLVTFERNVGARVSMVDQGQYRASMQALTVLEAAATALASDRVTADDLSRAREVNQRMADRLDDFDPRWFTARNLEFHEILFGRCPNERLLQLVRAEWARLGNLRDSIFGFVPARARASVLEHNEIVALVERRAPSSEIEHLMRRHRADTLGAFLAYADPDHTPHIPSL